MVVSTVIVLGLSLMMGCARDKVISPDNQNHEPEPVIQTVGYLPEYHVSDFPDSAASFLTDVIFFSAEPTPTGELDVARLTPGMKQALDRLRDRSPVRIHIAVGGWGRSDGFASMTRNETFRTSFVSQLLQFCRIHRFDGVDYDWEFPANAEEEQGYTQLIVETRNAFIDNSLSVSAAVNPYQSLEGDAYDALDRIHVMAYDNGGRHATYEQAVAAVNTFLSQDVPAEKIFLGVPFYGRGVEDRSIEMSYADIVALYDPAPDADEAAGIYFNGMETIRRKTQFALDAGLGGIMIWEIGQDSYQKNSLLKTIYQTIRDNREPG